MQAEMVLLVWDINICGPDKHVKWGNAELVDEEDWNVHLSREGVSSDNLMSRTSYASCTCLGRGDWNLSTLLCGRGCHVKVNELW